MGAIAAIGVLTAGITFGGATLAGVSFRGDESEVVEGADPATVAPDNDSAQSDGRVALFLPICVEAIDPGSSGLTLAALENLAKVKTEGALADISANNSTWQEIGVATVPEVHTGCPAMPLPISSGKPFRGRVPQHNISVGSVTAPSPYGLFIFVMPMEQIEQLLTTTTFRVVPQEYLCPIGGPTCSGSAAALYLTPDGVSIDADIVARGLETGLGLSDQSPSGP
ncbi:MAG TPA: hypothetical protein VGR43_03290 [Dehalococcoidia bacterium]|nr:hypothetical protein [Dehalococcoidia bacterium]